MTQQVLPRLPKHCPELLLKDGMQQVLELGRAQPAEPLEQPGAEMSPLLQEDVTSVSSTKHASQSSLANEALCP